MTNKEAYDKGFADGLHAYAINRDGEQWVGDPPTEIKDAVDNKEKTWNYYPPSEEKDER